MELHIKYKRLLESYGINTELRLAHFFAQAHHESGLKLVRESCYYTKISGLRATFKTPFFNKPDSFVAQYLKNSQKCANYVYANRMGNGPVSSGDGYFFRGGGWFQNTGRRMYELLKKETGIDFVANPDLILKEPNALLCALIYWRNNNLNILADRDDLDSISDIINIGRKTQKIGDANGYKHRKELLAEYKLKFEKHDTNIANT